MRTIKVNPKENIQIIKGKSYNQIWEEMQEVDQMDFDSEIEHDEEPSGWDGFNDCPTYTAYSTEIWNFDIILDLSEFDDEGDKAEGAAEILEDLFGIVYTGNLESHIYKVEGKENQYLCNFKITAPHENEPSY